MFIVNIMGFLFVHVILAVRYKEKIVTVVPVTTGIWIAALYVLAFFQRLHYIDIFCMAVLGSFIVCIMTRRLRLRKILELWCEDSAVMMLIIYVLVFLLMKNKMACSGDELGVWALETKNIFYVNGFSDKYQSMAVGYADYFPGQMLFGWWACHLSPAVFQEGLMYVGFWWLYVSYLMPILAKIQLKRKRYVAGAGLSAGILFILLPSVVEITGYSMLQAELLLSAAFAGSLWSYFDPEEHTKEFIFLRCLTSMASMILFKESGIFFAAVSLIFGMLLLRVHQNDTHYKARKRSVEQLSCKHLAGIGILTGLLAASWKVYCKLFERNTYFTNIFKNTFQSMSQNEYAMGELSIPLTKSFFKSILMEPLHIDRTFAVDLTIAGYFIIAAGLVFWCCRQEYMDQKERKIFYIYYPVIFIIYMLLLLLMHLFIFQESGYTDANIMMVSIARYAEPLFLGILIFLFMIILFHDKKREEQSFKNIVHGKCMIFACMIIACSNWPAVYHHVLNYADVNQSVIADRASVKQKCKKIVDELDAKMDEHQQGRILVVRDEQDKLEDIEYRRFAYALAPKSVIMQYLNVNERTEDEFVSDIDYMIRANHCLYVYFDDIVSKYLQRILGQDYERFNSCLLRIRIDENNAVIFSEAGKNDAVE